MISNLILPYETSVPDINTTIEINEVKEILIILWKLIASKIV